MVRKVQVTNFKSSQKSLIKCKICSFYFLLKSWILETQNLDFFVYIPFSDCFQNLKVLLNFEVPGFSFIPVFFCEGFLFSIFLNLYLIHKNLKFQKAHILHFEEQ